MNISLTCKEVLIIHHVRASSFYKLALSMYIALKKTSKQLKLTRLIYIPQAQFILLHMLLPIFYQRKQEMIAVKESTCNLLIYYLRFDLFIFQVRGINDNNAVIYSSYYILKMTTSEVSTGFLI